MAYEYDHDCPFEAYITNLGKYNEGELVGEWVKFPTTSEELQKVFSQFFIQPINITVIITNEPFFIRITEIIF